tara:strand:- start:166 stop:957 length:792 start_codon:yes stop_codon:yes gene_type:complete
MRKSKKDIEEEIIYRYHQQKAKILLEDKEYVKLLREHKKLSSTGSKQKVINLIESKIPKWKGNKPIKPSSRHYKNIKRVIELNKEIAEIKKERERVENKIQKINKKYNMPYMHGLKEIKEVAKGKGMLLLESDNIVQLVKLRSSGRKSNSKEWDDGYLDKNGCLHFAINPNETKEVIHFYLDRILDIYPFDKPKSIRRYRESTYDPIEIYNAVNKKGKNKLQIAKELCGRDAPPQEDEIVNAMYSVVKRAYDKGKKMLQKAKR